MDNNQMVDRQPVYACAYLAEFDSHMAQSTDTNHAELHVGVESELDHG